MSAALMLLLVLTLCPKAFSGTYNQVLDPGDGAPTWSELPNVDGKPHSLAGLYNKTAVVVVFTCNSCPYAVDVEDRLIALEAKYRERGVAVVAINVNKTPEDSPQAMQQKAEEKGFRFPYLFDESQQIARDYGAQATPEFFVLDRERRIAYMGSLDDSPDGKQVTKRHVEAALDALLQGEHPSVTETVPIGCRIRFERTRRR